MCLCLVDDCSSKKPKLHSEQIQNRWSLSNSTVFLDELFDSGVKLLDNGSDSSDECGQKNCNEMGDFGSDCKDLTPETKEKRVRNFQLA